MGSWHHSGAASAVRPQRVRTRTLYSSIAISTFVISLLPLTACGEPFPTAPAVESWPNRTEPDEDPVNAGVSAGTVDDLGVASATESTLMVEWTQVDDGTGQPAWYRLQYAKPPVDWSEADFGCASAITGTAIGEPMSCTVEGLDPGTTYDLRIMSYRVVDGAWEGTAQSNVSTGRTAASAANRDAVSDRGVWISPAELMQRPTSGPVWEQLLADAARDPGSADISDQDSSHDVATLAAALVCVRAGQHCAKAAEGVVDAIGTEDGARWLAVGRNLGAYVVAADLLGMRADGDPGSDGSRVERWIEGWLTKRLSENNDRSQLRGIEPFRAAANAAAQEGFVYTAIAAYLRDDAALKHAWDTFRTYACDRSSPSGESLDPANLLRILRDGWAYDDDESPCAVAPADARKPVPLGLPGGGSVRRMDGALAGDMRRGGVYQWPPKYTAYPWVGLEGFIPAAVILQRAGYPAFDVADSAVLRTLEYLWYVREETRDERWFDGIRSNELVSLVNVAYGEAYPINGVVGGGRTVGYTAWTHPARGSLGLR